MNTQLNDGVYPAHLVGAELKLRQKLFGRDPSVRELAEITAVSVFLAHNFIKSSKVLENNTPADAASENAVRQSSSDRTSASSDGVPVDRYGTVITENLKA